MNELSELLAKAGKLLHIIEELTGWNDELQDDTETDSN